MTLQTRWYHYAISVDYWFLSKSNLINPFHPDVVIIIFLHYDIIIFYYTLHSPPLCYFYVMMSSFQITSSPPYGVLSVNLSTEN